MLNSDWERAADINYLQHCLLDKLAKSPVSETGVSRFEAWASSMAKADKDELLLQAEHEQYKKLDKKKKVKVPRDKTSRDKIDKGTFERLN